MKDLYSIRWGIWGTGAMAHAFVQDLALAPGAVVGGIASRHLATAQEAARELGVARAYGSYEELLADPSIDIVYVATPNHRHFPDTCAALEAGKAVLCEKPFALDSEQARVMVELARGKGLFLMEAMWTRFLPSLRTLLDRVQDGVLGDPLFLRADFGFMARYDAHSRLFDAGMGGGALYDIGVYPLFLALLLFGPPEEVQALSVQAPSGVDLSTLVLLRHGDGRLSQLSASFALDLECEAHLHGSRGKLVLERMFHMPTGLSLYNDTGRHAIALPEREGHGYQFQAMAAMDALRRGLFECPEWTLDQTLALAELVQRVRDSLRGP